MKRVILLLLAIFGMHAFSFAQTALPIKPAAAEQPQLYYITSPAGQKYVLSLTKIYNNIVAGHDTLLQVAYDSLYYNHDGLIITQETGINNSKNKYSYEYDEFKRVVSKIAQYWGDNRWVNKSRSRYEYNSSGNLSQMYSDVYQSMSYWLQSSISTYTYDNFGRLLKDLTIFGNDSTDQEEYVYTYDVSGYIVDEKNRIYENNIWRTQYHITVVRDKFHNMVDSTVQTGWNGANYSDLYKTKFTRDDEGRPLCYVHYEIRDYLQNYDSTAYTYDDNGRLTYKLHATLVSHSEGSNGYLYVSDQYAYDISGHILAIETKYWDDWDYIYSEKTTNDYNDAGLLLSSNIEEWNDSLSIWKPVIRKTYSYDNSNQIESVLIKCLPDSIWTPFEKTEYMKNDVGNYITITHQLYRDGVWQDVGADITIPGTGLTYNGYKIELGYTLIDGGVSIDDNGVKLDNFQLNQNYPNPFNPGTKISFSLPQSGKASLKVYDMLGREVAELVNGQMEKGTHSINFNGRNLSSGVYIYRLQAGSFTESKKMMLMK